MVRPSDELVFAPLGGVGEIGMNLAVYGFGDEHRRQWIAVDFGVAFADDALPGVDLIMPDIRYLVEERRNVSASSSPTRTRIISARSSTCGRASNYRSMPHRLPPRCCKPSWKASPVRPRSR